MTPPLSAAELDELCEVLEAHSPYDYDGVLGLFNAVAIAPGMVMPSAWLPVLLPRELGDESETHRAIGLLMRTFNDVLDALNSGQMISANDEEDRAAAASFASGYAAGAALDPLWRNDDDRWTFASPLAYLGGRRDLVPPKKLAELDAMPDGKAIIHRHVRGLVAEAYRSFKQVRETTVKLAAQPRAQGATKVGRNDPCPCGSGKKYKRCCIA